ncbi:MAG: excisionase family DNA-binding protein [Polyangiaceae bacterium]
MQFTKGSHQMPSPYLLLHEIAEETRTPLSTVRHWIATGKLPSVRPGRRRLVRRADLDAFLVRPANDRAADSGTALPSELDRRRATDACHRLGLQP